MIDMAFILLLLLFGEQSYIAYIDQVYTPRSFLHEPQN